MFLSSGPLIHVLYLGCPNQGGGLSLEALLPMPIFRLVGRSWQLVQPGPSCRLCGPDVPVLSLGFRDLPWTLPNFTFSSES